MSRNRVILQASSQFVARTLTIVIGALLWTHRAVFSPVLGPSCRFAPSCSVYARQAIHHYGVARGTWMAARRLLRCHPFHPGGWDPIA